MGVTDRQFITRAGRTLRFTSLGFGSAPLGNYLRALPEAEADAILDAAWESGLRYFDTSPFYGLGLSERRVGRLLSRHSADRVTLSTKVGRLLIPCRPEEVNGGFFVETPQVRFVYDYSYDGVMRSFEESLQRLKCDRVDILYVHDICALVHGGREASEARIRELMETGGWRALDELRSSGVVDAIGAGVNEWQPCVRLLELADPDVFLLAGRYTLLEQEPLSTLFPMCAERNVAVVVGGPYNSGILAGGENYNYSKAPEPIVRKVRGIQSVCEQFGVRIHEAALQFVLAHPVVMSVIPGSQSTVENAQNAAALGARIPPAFWEALKSQGLLHSTAPVPRS